MQSINYMMQVNCNHVHAKNYKWKSEPCTAWCEQNNLHNVMATLARFSMRRGIGMHAVNLTYVNCNETSHYKRYAHKYEHTK